MQIEQSADLSVSRRGLTKCMEKPANEKTSYDLIATTYYVSSGLAHAYTALVCAKLENGFYHTQVTVMVRLISVMHSEKGTTYNFQCFMLVDR